MLNTTSQRTRILSQAMSVDRITSGAFALFCCDLKFFNTFQEDTQNFNTYCKISRYLGNRLTVDNHSDILIGKIYSLYLLDVDTRCLYSIMLDAHSLLWPHVIS